jgi:5'-3' exonuclease
MGIPSYYKKLIDTVPGLLSKGHPLGAVEWLFMDFNCLIYHCLHRADTPPPPSADATGDTKDKWEAEFLECIVQYCLKVIKQVAPQKGVYIAVDGVVPMAKMRQQRLRRFKSVWLAARGGDGNGSSGWDRNAITPGTAFMKKLRARLETMAAKHGKKTWTISSSDEPGEGEHKIIAEWRRGIYNGNFAVYGLDADLIVLAILGQECCTLENTIWLFREEVNAGKITYDDAGEEVFEWFSINALKDWLSSSVVDKRAFILNYCFAMSVLGNDFLPNSLSLKIREDGHADLLQIIRDMTGKSEHLINPDTRAISLRGLKELFRILAAMEDGRVLKYVQKKQMMGRNCEQETDLGENNWPLGHVEESVLIHGKQLRDNWKELYITHFFSGFSNTKKSINRICKEYLYGMQWIWAYYTGDAASVCFNWFYPFNLPPLWSDLRDYLSVGTLPEFPERVLVRAEDISPAEQLALVLPLESWGLIPPGRERKLPQLVPQYFPAAFSFESVGKRFFWECESMIPLPTILEVKSLLKV